MDTKSIRLIERLNDQINTLENSYGQGPFYDGAIRDRLAALWRERDAVRDAALSAADGAKP